MKKAVCGNPIGAKGEDGADHQGRCRELGEPLQGAGGGAAPGKAGFVLPGLPGPLWGSQSRAAGFWPPCRSFQASGATPVLSMT